MVEPLAVQSDIKLLDSHVKSKGLSFTLLFAFSKKIYYYEVDVLQSFKGATWKKCGFLRVGKKGGQVKPLEVIRCQ